MNYKQRMLTELMELIEKIVKLENYNKVNKNGDIELRKRQLEGMKVYAFALSERLMITLEDKEVNNDKKRNIS